MSVRPTKKQYETLAFIGQYISKNGYSPSYREIMGGCGYTSVATVALHIDNLIKRGHLRKRDRSARSLELADIDIKADVPVNRVNESEEKWLVTRVEQFFKQAETERVDEKQIDELYVLIGTLKILGLEEPALAYIKRLNELKSKRSKGKYSV